MAVVSSSPESRPDLGARLLQQVRLHAPFLSIGVGLLAVSQILKFILVGPDLGSLAMAGIGFILFFPMMVPALLPMLFFKIGVFDRAPSPARAFPAAVRDFLVADGRFLSGLIMISAIFAFMAGFAVLKALIPYVQPFTWDAAFDEWDRWLHFGIRPWQLLHPLLGHGPVSAFININYDVWFLTLSMFWLHFAFAEKPGILRSQAILSFMLTWTVGGVVLAILFSSAGPCFYDKLDLGSNPYAALMTYLHMTNETWPIWSLELQDSLWSNYASSYGEDITKGISAMPSMHNAQCLLLVLATWNKHRLVRNLAIIHGVLVFLGSIHLGWHYAIDAYLAFAVAAVAWVVSGRLARAWEYRRAANPVASGR